MILTDEQGRPIDRPMREDYPTLIEYALAFYAYKDRVASIANEAFADQFRKAMKGKRQ